jgi:hypothetical protein
MKVARATLMLAVLGSALGCGSRPAAKPEALFPESNEVAGWNQTREVRTFEAGNLWQYIDGDAEKYIKEGVQRTLTADYRYQNRIDAVVDIHAMATAEGAKKVFESESSVGSQAIQLGEAGRLYGASLVFWRGSYLVRLVAYSDAPGTANALVELARRIDERIRQQGIR